MQSVFTKFAIMSFILLDRKDRPQSKVESSGVLLKGT